MSGSESSGVRAAQPRLPDAVGPYRVERLIGRGATGAVYLARDPRDGRALALKVLPLAGDGTRDAIDEAAQRFRRGTEAAARLRHPGIVAVHASGVDEDGGRAWLAMDCLPGADLEARTSPGQLLPWEDSVDAAAQAAAALAHAHRQGVLHRDVKPANLIRDPASGRVWLTDFGLARLAEGGRTQTGRLAGTPSYLAPEQIAGLAADGRSDLYALGVVLFQLLCGRLPHPAATLGALLAQVAREPAPDLRGLRPDLPPALALVVARTLAKRPDGRPADGDALARELRETLPNVTNSRSEPRHNSRD